MTDTPKSPSKPNLNEFKAWLEDHFKQAMVRYDELSKLDDEDQEGAETGEYYEVAHQMFGYVSALDKVLKKLNGK